MKYKGKTVNKHRYRQLTKSRNNRRERLSNHETSFYPDVLDWFRKERDKYGYND